MRAFFVSLRPPRHPLLRIALGLAGLALLMLFSAVVLAAGLLLLIGFALRYAWSRIRQRYGRPCGQARAEEAIEGEYRVVTRSSPLPPPRET